MKKYQDNSIAPIVALDFDGTLCVGDSFPDPFNGTMREYANIVTQFLVRVGVKVVIWTSRDLAINQDELRVYDDITPVIKWCKRCAITYSAINRSVQFAPFPYNTRKIYAHRYVDDRGTGWVESPQALLYILHDILHNLLDVDIEICDAIIATISRTGRYDDTMAEVISQHVKEYWV